MDQEEKKQPEHQGPLEEREQQPRETFRQDGIKTAESVPYMERFYESSSEEAMAVEAKDLVALPAPELEIPEARETGEEGLVELNLGELAAAAVQDEAPLEQEESPESALSDEELSGVLEELCRSKAEEFRMLGYEQVIGKDIWDCVSDKYKKTGIPPLHRIVNDILSLKVTGFMNWMTMSIYKDAR
ncbi:post-transcriptional regulator [Paenibacillus gyeongsangnamensis]|uniref:post-transcriptional regulator n=1 Tax=Paenibacillus gyeongsangnamensis TaxID=3388067 RepID=UPI002FCFAEE4